MPERYSAQIGEEYRRVTEVTINGTVIDVPFIYGGRERPQKVRLKILERLDDGQLRIQRPVALHRAIAKKCKKLKAGQDVTITGLDIRQRTEMGKNSKFILIQTVTINRTPIQPSGDTDKNMDNDKESDDEGNTE